MADRNQNQPMHSGEGQQEDGRHRQQVVLTEEELRVLKECNQESFWYRCVPLGIVFVGSTQILVNKGFLNPNPRFGALFKNLGAALAAFVIGKVSYQGRCREKILSLENSTLAESIRKGKRGVELARDVSSFQEQLGFESHATEEQEPISRRYQRSGLSNEGNVVESKGLDETLRPSMDRETSLYQRTEEQTPEQPGLAYEELRQRNRMEYEKKVNPPKSKGPSETPASSRQPSATSSADHSSISESSWETESSTSKGGRRNKYGDIIE